MVGRKSEDIRSLSASKSEKYICVVYKMILTQDYEREPCKCGVPFFVCCERENVNGISERCMVK